MKSCLGPFLKINQLIGIRLLFSYKPQFLQHVTIVVNSIIIFHLTTNKCTPLQVVLFFQLLQKWDDLFIRILGTGSCSCPPTTPLQPVNVQFSPSSVPLYRGSSNTVSVWINSVQILKFNSFQRILLLAFTN